MVEPAAYQVVARRYRPQKFGDLVGQEHVARGLSEQLTQAVLATPIYSQVLEESVKRVPHVSTQKRSSAQTASTVNHVIPVIAVKQSRRVTMSM